jgi:isoleucyl-tRNA synthetase
MSKSLGNVISPEKIIKDYGADILRLWVSSSDYNDDVRISDKIIARLTEAYRKIRNTARFILGNLYDFNPDKDAIPHKELLEIDRWAISKAHSLLKEINGFYSSFSFHKVYHAIYNFCVVDMSNFYLDVLKDRLYTFKKDSLGRRSGQTAIYEVLKSLVTAIAPALVFSAEEIWQHMPRTKDMPKSVHLSPWPEDRDLRIEKELGARWEELRQIRDVVLKVLEAKRVSGIIGSSLEAKVLLYIESDSAYLSLKRYETNLTELFIVSQAELKRDRPPEDAVKDEKVSGVSVIVVKAEGKKCSRCWNYSLSVDDNKDYPMACSRCQKVLKDMKGDTK